MKKIQLITTSILCLLIIACSSDNDSNAVVDPTTKLKLKRTYNDSGSQTAFFYNEDGNIKQEIWSSATESTVKSFYYNNGVLTKVTATADPGEPTDDFTEINFTYEGNWIKQAIHYKNGILTLNATCTYTGSLLTAITLNRPNQENSFLAIEYDASGNVTKQTNSEGSFDPIVSEYSGYDNKINPIYAAYPEAFAKLDSSHSKNNYTIATEDYSPNNYFTYEYNQQGYPTKMVHTMEGYAPFTTYFEYYPIE